ncbi:MAG: TIGR01777 family protein [Fibrella sp.]|nr:TIGR01777 family protein [Armatimonadota bacterium]
MRVVLAGGSGQVGTILARALGEAGHHVTVLSRQPGPAGQKTVGWETVPWDGRTLGGDWTAAIDGADAVINLAGRSVNCRYTPENQEAILSSRVDSTRVVGEAIAQAKHPPAVWLQMSTATIYAHRYDAANGEYSGVIGGTEPNVPNVWAFSIEVAKAWEEALDHARTPQTRKVALRSAMVMSPDKGGVFDTLLTLVRFGLGGTCGNGKQYVSWIHEADFVKAILHLLAHKDIGGAVNLASPNPLPNAAFMKALRNAWGMPLGLPAADWMLEIGARVLKTESELILKSRRVVPTRLQQSGFTFEYGNWDAAAKELCQRWRSVRAKK